MFLAVLLRVALVILHEYRNLNIIENVIFNLEDREIHQLIFFLTGYQVKEGNRLQTCLKILSQLSQK